MSKVKFVQISLGGHSERVYGWALDDKGRVWSSGNIIKGDWRTIESPDEPKGEQNE